MSKFLSLEQDILSPVQLKVVGVGSEACKTIEFMISKGLQGVEYIAVNVDSKVLNSSRANHKIQVDSNSIDKSDAKSNTNGWVGQIKALLEKSNLIFVIIAMNENTCATFSTIIAEIAKDIGILVIGLITCPYLLEDKNSIRIKEEDISRLSKIVDNLIICPHKKILEGTNKEVLNTTLFGQSSEFIFETIRTIVDIITVPGSLNVDFADFKSVLTSSGESIVGLGIANGKNRTITAAEKALSSLSLYQKGNIKFAKNILLNVTGSENLTLQEIDEGNQIIYNAIGNETNIFFGLVNKDKMNDSVSYSIIASGFELDYKKKNNNTKINKTSKSVLFENSLVKKEKLRFSQISSVEHGQINQYNAEPKVQKDQVDCTIFSPPEVKCGESLLLQVFLHLIDKAEEATTLAQEFDEDAVRRGFTSLNIEIEQGSILTFELSFTGLKIEDTLQNIKWQGRTNSVEYEVQIPNDFHTDNLIGKVVISQDSIPIGHIRFKIKVIKKNQVKKEYQKDIPIGSSKMYNYAFISYASQDREEVLRRVQMLSKLNISYFQDIMTLEPGDKWAKEIYKHIDKADVFFLFWSKAASKSEWVSKEINYALKLKRGNDNIPLEILPIILEKPPIPEPPPELKDIHFNDKIIYFIN